MRGVYLREQELGKVAPQDVEALLLAGRPIPVQDLHVARDVVHEVFVQAVAAVNTSQGAQVTYVCVLVVVAKSMCAWQNMLSMHVE
jgi:hypothetical protein